MYKIKLVLIRHGESEWNKLNLFTGWTDVGLSEKGIEEAKAAGRILKEKEYKFDVCYSSVLKRAIHTAYHALNELDLNYIPVIKNFKLNERHYGALQGLNKAETAEKYGAEKVHLWRRSYDVAPPALQPTDERNPANQEQYAHEKRNELPLNESLKDTVKRVVPYFKKVIAPEIKAGKNVLIVAHGNSLRALVKYLDNISDADIADLNIPTGVPLVYELDNKLQPIDKKHYYLGDQEQINASINAVKNQDSTKSN